MQENRFSVDLSLSKGKSKGFKIQSTSPTNTDAQTLTFKLEKGEIKNEDFKMSNKID